MKFSAEKVMDLSGCYSVAIAVTVLIQKVVNLLGCCSVVVSVAVTFEKVMNLSGCCSVVVAVAVRVEKVMKLSGCCSVVDCYYHMMSVQTRMRKTLKSQGVEVPHKPECHCCCSVAVSVAVPIKKIMHLSGWCSVVVSVRVHI